VVQENERVVHALIHSDNSQWRSVQLPHISDCLLLTCHQLTAKYC